MQNELKKQYEGVFEKWKIDLALSRIEHMGFPKSDWPDLMQELTISLLEFRYEPDKANGASKKTVLFSVISRRLKHLWRKEYRIKDLHLRYATKCGSDDEAVEYPFHPTVVPTKENVNPIIANLSGFDRDVCKAFAAGCNINQAAEVLDCDWHTVNKAVGRIRKHFRNNGIDGWV